MGGEFGTTEILTVRRGLRSSLTPTRGGPGRPGRPQAEQGPVNHDREALAPLAQPITRSHLRTQHRVDDGLLRGDWDPADYLVVPPAAVIEGVYDRDEIVRARVAP